MSARTWLLCLGLVGCATTQPAPRTALQHYYGQPYDIRDEGRRISGSVCGIDVDYSVALGGGGTVLNGFFNGYQGALHGTYIEVKPTATGRHITGTTGARPGLSEIDLYVDDAGIRGRAGLRSFDLRPRGDAFAGRMTALNTIGSAVAVVNGRAELAQLPNADLGAILPPLLNCSAPMGRRLIRPNMMVGIGGAPGYDTRAANELH